MRIKQMWLTQLFIMSEERILTLPLLIRHINLHQSHFIGSQILFSVCFDNLTERHTYVKD